MGMTSRPLVVTLALAMASVACRRPTSPSVEARDGAVSSTRSIAEDAGATEDGASTPEDASQGNGATDAAAVAPVVLTLRIVNAASRAVPFFTNPDINEMIHTRRMRSRRSREDGGRDSDPVKFFPVGQMPLCAQDGGAGYGGLGQPERREVLDRQRGVCLEVAPPQPGRYRFEIDQPRRTLRCDDAEISFPLRDDAPRVLEMRCRLRTSSDDRAGDEEG
jgi:hypothetical protein